MRFVGGINMQSAESRRGGFWMSVRVPVGGIVLALLTLSALYAQTITTGDIAGTIKDTSGAVVPNATVTLKSVDTGQTRTATPNASGEYRFTTLQQGNYQISATSAGLKSNTTSVSIAIGQVSTIDLTLQPNTSTTIVQVTEAAPLLQNENGNM